MTVKGDSSSTPEGDGSSSAGWEDDSTPASSSTAADQEINSTYRLLDGQVKNREYRTAMGAFDRKVENELNQWWEQNIYQGLQTKAEAEYQQALAAYNQLSSIRQQTRPQPTKNNPSKIMPATARTLSDIIKKVLRIVIMNALFRGKSIDEAINAADTHYDDLTQALITSNSDYGTVADVVNYYNTHIKDTLTDTVAEAEQGKQLLSPEAPSSPASSAQGEQTLNLSIEAQANLLQAVSGMRNPNYDDDSDSEDDNSW
jgi:hypothetical protein